MEVLRAIEEYDRLGRDVFLLAQGFGEARRFRLSYQGRLYDSKAIVGAAHGYLPGQSALVARDFSGGVATVVALLRRLGFTVIDAKATEGDGSAGHPEYTAFEAAIADLRMRATRQGPALHQPILLLWAIGRARRGDARLTPWSTTEREVGKLLSRHGARGERPRPDYPAAALHRAGLWEMRDHGGPAPSADGDRDLARWFDAQQPRTGLPLPVYETMRDSPPDRARSVGTLLRYFVGVDQPAVFAFLSEVGLGQEGGVPASSAGPVALEGAETAYADAVRTAARYEQLCRSVERGEVARHGRRVPRQTQELLRSAPAREAVLIRSADRCENPRCCGQPDDRTDNGDPILEVDHVQELALGGRDHPSQMIALCPNCHAVKTRGRTRETFRAELLSVAERLHYAMCHARGPEFST